MLQDHRWHLTNSNIWYYTVAKINNFGFNHFPTWVCLNKSKIWNMKLWELETKFWASKWFQKEKLSTTKMQNWLRSKTFVWKIQTLLHSLKLFQVFSAFLRNCIYILGFLICFLFYLVFLLFKYNIIVYAH